jgi:hypothetical protein
MGARVAQARQGAATRRARRAPALPHPSAPRAPWRGRPPRAPDRRGAGPGVAAPRPCSAWRPAPDVAPPARPPRTPPRAQVAAPSRRSVVVRADGGFIGSSTNLVSRARRCLVHAGGRFAAAPRSAPGARRVARGGAAAATRAPLHPTHPAHPLPPCQIMVASTGAFLAAGRFGLAPTVSKGTTAGLKLVERSNAAGIMSNDPSGEREGAAHVRRGPGLWLSCSWDPRGRGCSLQRRQAQAPATLHAPYPASPAAPAPRLHHRGHPGPRRARPRGRRGHRAGPARDRRPVSVDLPLSAPRVLCLV